MRSRIQSFPSRLLLGTLAVYRRIASPLIAGIFGPSCRFNPTCSEYAQEAIARFGTVRGSAMAARRLARCHPLGGHGYDPVERTEVAGN